MRVSFFLLQYLLENNRMVNIFTDLYYLTFVQELNKSLSTWQPTLLPNSKGRGLATPCPSFRSSETAAESPRLLGPHSPGRVGGSEGGACSRGLGFRAGGRGAVLEHEGIET